MLRWESEPNAAAYGRLGRTAYSGALAELTGLVARIESDTVADAGYVHYNGKKKHDGLWSTMVNCWDIPSTLQHSIP